MDACRAAHTAVVVWCEWHHADQPMSLDVSHRAAAVDFARVCGCQLVCPQHCTNGHPIRLHERMHVAHRRTCNSHHTIAMTSGGIHTTSTGLSTLALQCDTSIGATWQCRGAV